METLHLPRTARPADAADPYAPFPEDINARDRQLVAFRKAWSQPDWGFPPLLKGTDTRPLKILAPLFLGAFALATCGGSAEKQGEEMDSPIEETVIGEIDIDHGLLENTGEVIDEVTGTEDTDPVDAAEEATEDAPG